MKIPDFSLRPRLGRHLISLALVAAAGLSFLLSPPAAGPDTKCHLYWPVNDWAGIPVNCDFQSFEQSAEHPEWLLQPQALRQSRPLFVAAGAVTGRALRVLGIPYPFFWGNVLLNFLLLHLALVLFLGVADDAGADHAIALAVLPLLAWNIVTKNFLYTPHQQLFTLFTPALTVRLTARALKRRDFSVAAWSGWGLGVGLLCLLYGNFLPLGACLLAALLIRARREGQPPRSTAASGAALAAAAAAPILAWVAITTVVAGSYYNHEMAKYRQLVWLLDAARLGPGGFRHALATNTLVFLRTFEDAQVQALTMTGAAGAALLLILNNPESRTRGRDELIAAGLTLAFSAAFFWLLGFYQSRLTFNLALPSLFLLVAGLSGAVRRQPQLRRALAIALAVLSAGWAAWNIVSYGPFY